MTFCSSSLLLPLTRTASPWICDLSLGKSSRISLVIFLARSSGSPRRRPMRWRTVLRQATPHRLRLEQVAHRLGPKVSVGAQDDLVLAQLELGLGALEVVARRDL